MMPRVTTTDLGAAPLFAGLPSRTLRRVSAITEIVEVPAGHVIVREGSNDRRFYVLMSGQADVSVRGRRRDSLGPGEFFGELAILNRSSRSATVTASTRARLAVIDARDFVRLVESEPRVALHLLSSLARRFEWLARRPAGELR